MRLFRSLTWSRHRLLGPAGVVGTVLLAGCEGSTRPEPERVAARVELSDSAVGLADGGATVRLQATVLDGSGERLDLPVAWRSSAPGVATVDTTGTVTSVGPGVSWITASHVRRDGMALRDSAAVTVRAVPASIQVLPNRDSGGVGTVLPLTVRVLDRNGRGIPGVEVEFAVAEGSATVAPARDTTDVLGTASASLTLGQEPGPVRVDVRLAGSELRTHVTARVVRYTLQFEPDSLVFPAPGCTGDILARAGTSTGPLMGLSIPYSVVDSSVVTLEIGRGSGALRGMHRIVTARKPGATRIVAGFEGVADTAVARVGPDTAAALRVEYGYPNGLATGDSARIAARVVNACGAEVAGATPGFSSSNPRVATLSPDGWVRTRAAGRSLVVVRYGRFADSVLVDVRDVKVEPADTTVVVGDTVRYRVWEADSAGVFTPARSFGIGSSSEIAATGFQGTVPVAVARGVGTATIGVSVRSRTLPASLRVVARPSGGASRAIRPGRSRSRP